MTTPDPIAIGDAAAIHRSLDALSALGPKVGAAVQEAAAAVAAVEAQPLQGGQVRVRSPALAALAGTMPELVSGTKAAAGDIAGAVGQLQQWAEGQIGIQEDRATDVQAQGR